MTDVTSPLALRPTTAIAVTPEASLPAVVAPSGLAAVPRLADVIETPSPRSFFGLFAGSVPVSPYHADLTRGSQHVALMQQQLAIVQNGVNNDAWILAQAVPDPAKAFAPYVDNRAALTAVLTGLAGVLAQPMAIGSRTAYDTDGRQRYGALIAGAQACEVTYDILAKTVGARAGILGAAKMAEIEKAEARLAAVASMSPERRKQLDADVAMLRDLNWVFAQPNGYSAITDHPLAMLTHEGETRFGAAVVHGSFKVITDVATKARVITSVDELLAVIDKVRGRDVDSRGS